MSTGLYPDNRNRTQRSRPLLLLLSRDDGFVIWHTKSIGMSRSAFQGAAKSVGEGVWVGWTGMAYRWDGGGSRRDDEWCFINPSSRGARTDVISTMTALEQQKRHPGHLPVRLGILVSGVTCRWSG